MRGKEVQGLLQDLVGGITPAYAGKSHTCSIGFPALQDHPRVCGEKYPSEQHGVRTMGSPLRVRGKAGLSHGCLVLVGITPARAGKRVLCLGLPVLRWDHPRVCGEKLSTTSTDIHPAGSPPPVRGKDFSMNPKSCRAGITPPCAGKSSIQHLTASLGEFKVQKGHPVPHLRQRLQVWPDHARHLRHGLILHASRSAGQGRRLCPGPCPDTAGSGTPRGPSPAKCPHTSPPAATPGGCRAWQSGATAPGSR